MIDPIECGIVDGVVDGPITGMFNLDGTVYVTTATSTYVLKRKWWIRLWLERIWKKANRSPFRLSE